jgi:hypothetical protein
MATTSPLEDLGIENPEDEQLPDDDFGGDGMPKLPEDKQVILKDLLKKALQREIYSRRTEVIDARLQRFYSRSVQYIYWNWSTGMFAPLMQGGANNSADQERYCEVYDIYSAFLRTLVAALSQNPLAAHMVPRTPKRTVDIAAAEAAEYYRNRIEQINEVKQLQVDLARFFCTDGRVVGMVVKKDPDPRYGMDANGDPVGAEIIELDGILEWKVPITQSCMEHWPYAVRSKELELEFAQDKYPECVDDEGDSKIITGSASAGESAYERMARLGVLQGTKLLTATGETWEHLVTEHIGFFRPSFYRAAAKENRDWLKETFPNGLKLVVTGNAYCGAWDCKMDDYLDVGHCKPGDGQNRTSLLKAMVPIQDAFNDLWNLQKEIFEYCIPEKWLDKETYDLVAQQEHRSEPGNSNPVVLQPGEDIRTKIFVEGNIEVPATMINAMDQLSGALAQLITAALPSLMGTADEHNETKGGIAMMREQALGQMGIAWGASQNLLGKLEELAVRMAGREQPGDTKLAITIPGGNTAPDSVKDIEISELNAGDFCYEVDDSFPDTRAMRRAVFNSLLAMSEKSPTLQAILALPENQALFKEMVDPDLEIPGADARLQQKREIDQLLKSAPIPPSPQQIQQAVQGLAQKALASMQPGQPPPPPPPPQVMMQITQSLTQPSVPIDAEWDFNELHLEEIKDWLASNECYEELQKGNQAGVQNVKLHGDLHKKAIAAQTPPPQQKPPSESINFADLPDAGKIQLAAKGGITLSPQDIQAADLKKQAEQALKPKGPSNA